jgi:hypothetical protein
LKCAHTGDVRLLRNDAAVLPNSSQKNIQTLLFQ